MNVVLLWEIRLVILGLSTSVLFSLLSPALRA